ncbi:biliverdin reductase A-like [Octopus vulgaris]|uniref:Biliverdin reductase A-like n=1 Tax=Octopus vulgaris TaxID=6645 RepID=A0AA36AM20_OCTVU|nr:biliverdin reductase A-like [Octopus vulgaris]
MESFGVVVVGIGIAGQVRIRDLRNLPADKPNLQCLKLIGYVSRRQLDLDLLSLTLPEALNRSDVQVIIICTEAEAHEETIRKSLEAGKHVLVEYPIVMNVTAAKELYQMASSKGVVLHEENIGLLSLALLELKKDIDNKPPLQEVQLAHHVSLGRLSENMTKEKTPFIAHQSIIKAAIFLFGNLTSVGGQLTEKDDCFEAIADLRTSEDKKVQVKLFLFKEKGIWKKEYFLKFKDGSVIDKLPPELVRKTRSGLGMFMEDLLHFSEKLLGVRDVHDTEELTIKTIDLIEKIHSYF